MEGQEVDMVEAAYSPEEQIRALVENISAYIEHFHGGSVELVSYNEGVARVKLGGACLGCPLSPATLHGWVEGTIKQFFPDVKIQSDTE
jgi:Fe-S cluster biogenesis protein NfuA